MGKSTWRKAGNERFTRFTVECSGRTVPKLDRGYNSSVEALSWLYKI
jgi:hypothetical protein